MMIRRIPLSNQRPGKTHKAAASDSGQDMKMRNFFRTCKTLLNNGGYADAAFYFEQIQDLYDEGKSLPTEPKDISRLLGL